MTDGLFESVHILVQCFHRPPNNYNSDKLSLIIGHYIYEHPSRTTDMPHEIPSLLEAKLEQVIPK